MKTDTKFHRLEGAYNLSRNTRDPERWTAEEWLRLYDCYKASGWDFSPDEWDPRQVRHALQYEIVPEWDANEKPLYPETPIKLSNFK